MHCVHVIAGIILCAMLRSLPATAQTTKIEFSTYLGGSGLENLRDIATDSLGNIYVTGGTSSADFPTTAGAYDRTFATGGTSLGSGGPMDVFVAKFTPQGQLVWSTYLGGPNYDRAYALEVDRQGFVYVGGRAGEGFPTTPGVVQPAFAGDDRPNTAYGKQDPFIAKLSPDGSTLVWSTYFGSEDAGIIRDFDIDSIGNVFVVAPGCDSLFPHITAGAFQTAKPGGADMVVAKISNDGSRVIWASYVGGSLGDGSGPSVRVDEAGHAYFIGATASQDLPVTPNAFDRDYNGGRTDFMIGKFLPDGSGLVYLTYFGGAGEEGLETHNIAVDGLGQAYICGYTTSTNLPVTAGAFQRTYGGGGNDVPLAKFSSDGTRLLACSYLGGPAADGSQGIALSTAGNIVVGGASQAGAFPTTPDAYQSTPRGAGDIMVAVLSGDLSTLRYSTLLGGTSNDDGRTAWMDRNGTFYVAGHSASSDYPRVNSSIPHAGGHDGVITKFVTVASPNDSAIITINGDCHIAHENGAFALRIDRAGPTTGDVYVRLALSGPAAGDFTIPFEARINDGQSTTLMPMSPIDDTLAQGARSVTVSIMSITSDNPTRAGNPSSTTVWLVDDESTLANILADPGFEYGGGWQKTGNGGRAIDSGVALTGRRSLRMMLSNQFPREVMQVVPVVAGRTYLASGWMNIVRFNSASATIQLFWLDSAGAVIGTPVFVGGRFGTQDWTRVTACAVAPAGADSVRFHISASVEVDNEGHAHFDDLELVDASARPATVGRESITDFVLTHTLTPNPARRDVTLRFALQAVADVAFDLVDMQGRIVAHQAFERTTGESVVLTFDGIASGSYVYRLRARSGAATQLAQGRLIIIAQ